ncbi:MULTISPECIES: TlrC/CarA/OleB/SrmB family ABC-F type ribosomal protection protein [unclassified Streptomyces]|uniref:TlrC/CarA/OleB/SrmB family ABC-F type ribosomal protection protein n=1 Tax=unclassified Streptomyces TaxID=2593676 RepID=UPI0023669D31|nr:MULTISPECIES: TlrC/CarA/OleB/SrmB family ABC-F type ribosomal protection protein [unclassified Streptomyces]MDF3145753.1 TlrC/CarA/OleB/SrmB family ABC-F type ribosomal protection protein [Streptomyces sp. T21Q-yed]WDF44134.1 TlrC/CarA/OleB/SrmB family ABC-F type ribosomal protection protein [Streptomyces sp. T12]
MFTAQLSLQNVTRRYDDHVVLDDVSFSIKPGEKAGIIGDNGAGKSTLLRLIAGQDRPDNGELTVIAPGGVGHLAQSLALPPEACVQDAVDVALADVRDLEARMRRAEAGLKGLAGAELTAALDAYAHLVAQYEARAGYEADARVDIALHGLGLPGLARDRTLGTLSGGERSRLALAAALASQPELLLLDEPTNDLDDQAVGWLEAHLRAHRGTVLAVTHDRVFLERVTTTILEVGEGKVTRYGDGYDGYLAAKAAERRRRLQEYEDWCAELARNQKLAATNVARLEAIPRKLPFAVFGQGGFRARSRSHGAMSRIRNAKERVERLTDNPVAPPPEPLVFAARMTTADGRTSQTAAELTGIRVGDRLHVPSLRVGGEERLLVTGPNGAGKTTLIRVLAGELRPDEGTVRTRGRVGHLRQEDTPWPPRLTVPQAFAYGRGGDLDEHTDHLLSLGLFSPSDLRLKVSELSYGQRRRIELARLVSDPVDLLLLDEPTNHLSPALVEELEGALTGYRGAVVVVTHDRRMRTRFTGTHLELSAGRVAQLQEAEAS